MENQTIMRKVCLILITVLAISNANAQKYVGLGDTIVVYIDHRVEIKLSVADYSTFSEDHAAYKLLMRFQSLLPEVTGRLDPETPDMVTYNGEDKLVVEEGALNYQFLLDDEGIRDTGFRDVAILDSKESFVMITSTDISIISELQLQKCFSEVIPILPESKNNSYRVVYDCNNGSVTLREDELSSDASIDMLSLTAGAGAGLIKNQWVADLSAEIGLHFNRKGVLAYNPYVSANMIFDFDAEDNISTNTFLNLGFRWNQDRKSDRPDWLGLELGYLISQNGDMFGDNTFKFGLNWSLIKGRSVYVSPQLYFTDNFNTVYPAIRIGIGL